MLFKDVFCYIKTTWHTIFEQGLRLKELMTKAKRRAIYQELQTMRGAVQPSTSTSGPSAPTPTPPSDQIEQLTSELKSMKKDMSVLLEEVNYLRALCKDQFPSTSSVPQPSSLPPTPSNEPSSSASPSMPQLSSPVPVPARDLSLAPPLSSPLADSHTEETSCPSKAQKGTPRTNLGELIKMFLWPFRGTQIEHTFGPRDSPMLLLVPHAFLKLNNHFSDNVLDKFEASLIGPNQSQQAIRNIKQRKSYVKEFLLYMSGNKRDINKTFNFLNDMQKLNGCVVFTILL